MQYFLCINCHKHIFLSKTEE